jgi:DnaB-like helicase C terminal domain/Toprim-like
MSQAIPEKLRASQGLKFVIEQGWNWELDNTGTQIIIETCPYCKSGDKKFYMAVADPKESSRDGLHFCHKGSCSKTGNLRTLAEHIGVRIAGVDSRKEWAGQGEKQHDDLPNVELCHAALLGDADAMDYLLNVRGFTKEIIDRQKLGLKEKVFFREAGESKALVIPYLVGGNIVFAKFRTLPPKPKDFITPSGWDAPLYNGEILQEGLEEVIFVEGETNTISLMMYGVKNVVGVPGAGTKKAIWIDALDKIQPKIYILYDNDKAGKKAAQEIASRIGIEKCRKLILPPFTVTVPEDQCKLCDIDGITADREYDADGVISNRRLCGHQRDGKDINEWFRFGGGTLDLFEKMKYNAGLFDVTGVTSTGDALQQLEDELNGKVDLAPKYVFQWPELNRLIGMEDGDVLDIVAPEKVGKTTFGLNILDHMVAQYGEDGLLVCLEMTQARLARKWVALVTGFEDTMTEPNTDASRAKLVELKDCVEKARSIQQSRGADLYFAYPQMVKEPEDVFKLIRDCIRRYGVKWVMFDNLQRLCDDTLKNQGHRTVQLSQISKSFAKLAKDYRIKLIRILQPKRIERGQTISTNDVDGSSQVAKDCDAMVTLWRSVVGELKKSEWETQQQGFEESNESFEPVMKVTVGLSRYSAGGSTKLFYDGARSQVRSLRDDQKIAMKPSPTLPTGSIPMEGGGSKQIIPTETLTSNIVPVEGDITI